MLIVMYVYSLCLFILCLLLITKGKYRAPDKMWVGSDGNIGMGFVYLPYKYVSASDMKG